MELMEKLRILGAAAKYDASCSSSGSKRTNSGNGTGNASYSGICHSWSDDGRCISLLKILLTNYCIYDCAYCFNRRSNSIERTMFTVDELVNLTINFYQRNYIEGLFLSSGVYKDPDTTMEMILQAVKKLRLENNFHGYIHIKSIPGADPKLVREAGFYADRMSVNIELPSEKGLKLLAPQKSSGSIFQSMSFIGENILENKENKKKNSRIKSFVPAGQSTQLIVGATPENDFSIIRLSENLYRKLSLKRVYYSAYVPVNNDAKLPALSVTPPLKRENRLYQADWLLRFYHFKADEILEPSHPYLDEDFDPKTGWALRNLHFFPVDINQADYEAILRVPGIGVKSAQRILSARKFNKLNFDHLQKMGIVLKRARYFITCSGQFLESFDMEVNILKNKLLFENNAKLLKKNDELLLFPAYQI
jgi:putative DNA modification/repair radical SAM protein